MRFDVLVSYLINQPKYTLSIKNVNGMPAEYVRKPYTFAHYLNILYSNNNNIEMYAHHIHTQKLL